jgi:hypothetical protein
MLQGNTHSFPSNYWRNKITKGKESNKCDLCRALWTAEERVNTEDELPIQTLGHIQHQCEALSEIHTLTHHRCWRIIHAELGRLASTKWRFICINGGKTLKTIWNELEAEFPTTFNNCSVQLLENATTVQVGHHHLTAAEQRKRHAGITEETIAIDRLWKKRPDGFAIKKPTDTKGGELVILEFKHMSCVTDRYVKRAKHVAETQYAPLKSVLQKTLGLQGWTVTQKSFISGARSLNE